MSSPRYTLQAACAAFLLAFAFAPLAKATSAKVDTSTQKSTGFEDGTIAPFSICTTQSPNYGQPFTKDGVKCIKFFWQQSAYNGTRLTRGAEACSSLTTFKEGWYGFRFYLPSPGYPTNKEAAIGQIFQSGACNSWAALLIVKNNALRLQYRGACVTPVDVLIAADIQRNAWKPVVIHFVASHQNAGTMEVWYNGTRVYSATGINFGFGTWSGDTLAAGNSMNWHFGQYDYDSANYTAGETRTSYYDNVCQISGNPSGAYNTANP
jgi:hypothetical protein